MIILCHRPNVGSYGQRRHGQIYSTGSGPSRSRGDDDAIEQPGAGRVVNRYPSQNVVGESRYVRDLKKLAKRLGGGPTGEAITTAVLLAEPFNEYDAKAVAVTIDGDTVGYLPREDAVTCSAVLQDLSRRGVAISVPARVWWSQADGGDWMASVRLDLGPPGLLVPVNAPCSRRCTR